MLIKQLLMGGGDYKKSLKLRRWVAIGMLAAGVVGLVCYFLLISDSDLNDYVRGWYMGVVGALCGSGGAWLMRVQYLLSNPEAQREDRIRQSDERERKIVHTAIEAAGGVTFYASVVALFVALPLSIDAFRALTAVTVLYAVSFYVAYVWLSKKL